VASPSLELILVAEIPRDVPIGSIFVRVPDEHRGGASHFSPMELDQAQMGVEIEFIDASTGLAYEGTVTAETLRTARINLPEHPDYHGGQVPSPGRAADGRSRAVSHRDPAYPREITGPWSERLTPASQMTVAPMELVARRGGPPVGVAMHRKAPKRLQVIDDEESDDEFVGDSRAQSSDDDESDIGDDEPEPEFEWGPRDSAMFIATGHAQFFPRGFMFGLDGTDPMIEKEWHAIVAAMPELGLAL
jgi:hypothetical protein